MSTDRRQLTTMTAGAVLGGVVGWLLGLVTLSPATLIPIGVVVGLSISLAVLRRP